MISVESRGRLGNHMFQFAFGLAASTRLGTDFAMNDELLRPEFDLGPWRSVRRRIPRSIRFQISKRFSPAPVVKIDNQDDPDLALPRLEDGVHYAGFFQSLRYFENVQPLVRSAFAPHPAHVERFRARYGELAERPYVCCHVRQTDYLDGGWALPMSFYADCLDLVGDMPVVFVGDDLTEAERTFGDRAGVRFERNDEIVDLQLVIHATTVVTSNSSFGWWGSWLGVPGRDVYAPQHWIGFRTGVDVPRSVVPPEWRQVSVR